MTIFNAIEGHQWDALSKSSTTTEQWKYMKYASSYAGDAEIRRKVLLAIKHRTADRASAAAVRASGADGATDGHADAAA